ACKKERDSSQVMDSLLGSGLAEQLLEPFAGTSERRHHSTDWHIGDRRDLLVGTAFEFAQDEHFARARRELFERLSKTFAFAAGYGLRFRTGQGREVQRFVEFYGAVHRAILLHPGKASVAHNLQQPGTRVTTMKT